MNYKCIFFDLDHTLWDYEANSSETLFELFHVFSLKEKGVTSFEKFRLRFKEVNLKLWDLYDRGIINSEVIRNERFKKILEPFGAYEKRLADHLSGEYLKICPQKGNVMPHAIKTLEYLSTKYNLTIITNGFEDTQHIKLASAKLGHFFDHVITSQKAGCKKPAKEIFDFALQLNAIDANEAIMIGDNLNADIKGARNASIDAVFFNPESVSHIHEATHEIQNLNELCSFL